MSCIYPMAKGVRGPLIEDPILFATKRGAGVVNSPKETEVGMGSG